MSGTLFEAIYANDLEQVKIELTKIKQQADKISAQAKTQPLKLNESKDKSELKPLLGAIDLRGNTLLQAAMIGFFPDEKRYQIQCAIIRELLSADIYIGQVPGQSARAFLMPPTTFPEIPAEKLEEYPAIFLTKCLFELPGSIQRISGLINGALQSELSKPSIDMREVRLYLLHGADLQKEIQVQEGRVTTILANYIDSKKPNPAIIVLLLIHLFAQNKPLHEAEKQALSKMVGVTPSDQDRESLSITFETDKRVKEPGILEYILTTLDPNQKTAASIATYLLTQPPTLQSTKDVVNAFDTMLKSSQSYARLMRSASLGKDLALMRQAELLSKESKDDSNMTNATALVECYSQLSNSEEAWNKIATVKNYQAVLAGIKSHKLNAQLEKHFRNARSSILQHQAHDDSWRSDPDYLAVPDEPDNKPEDNIQVFRKTTAAAIAELKAQAIADKNLDNAYAAKFKTPPSLTSAGANAAASFRTVCLTKMKASRQPATKYTRTLDVLLEAIAGNNLEATEQELENFQKQAIIILKAAHEKTTRDHPSTPAHLIHKSEPLSTAIKEYETTFKKLLTVAATQFYQDKAQYKKQFAIVAKIIEADRKIYRQVALQRGFFTYRIQNTTAKIDITRHYTDESSKLPEDNSPETVHIRNNFEVSFSKTLAAFLECPKDTGLVRGALHEQFNIFQPFLLLLGVVQGALHQQATSAQPGSTSNITPSAAHLSSVATQTGSPMTAGSNAVQEQKVASQTPDKSSAPSFRSPPAP